MKIVFWRRSGIMNLLIKFLTFSEFCHVSVIIYDYHVELLPAGVVIRRVDNVDFKDSTVCSMWNDQINFNAEYLKILFKEIFDRSLVGILNGITCSEFIARILRSVGLFSGDCSWITPEDLWRLAYKERVER